MGKKTIDEDAESSVLARDFISDAVLLLVKGVRAGALSSSDRASARGVRFSLRGVSFVVPLRGTRSVGLGVLFGVFPGEIVRQVRDGVAVWAAGGLPAARKKP